MNLGILWLNKPINPNHPTKPTEQLIPTLVLERDRSPSADDEDQMRQEVAHELEGVHPELLQPLCFGMIRLEGFVRHDSGELIRLEGYVIRVS